MRTGLILSLALIAALSFAASGGRSLATENGLTFAKCDCSDPDCKCSPKAIRRKGNAERAAPKRAKQEKAAPQKRD